MKFFGKVHSAALSSVVEHVTVEMWSSQGRRFDSSSADFFRLRGFFSFLEPAVSLAVFAFSKDPVPLFPLEIALLTNLESSNIVKFFL